MVSWGLPPTTLAEAVGTSPAHQGVGPPYLPIDEVYKTHTNN